MSTPNINSKGGLNLNESHIGSTSRFNLGLKGRLNAKRSMGTTHHSSTEASNIGAPTRNFMATNTTGVFKAHNTITAVTERSYAE